MTAYCTRCKASRTVSDDTVEVFTTKNNHPAQRAKCPACGGTIVRMGAPKIQP